MSKILYVQDDLHHRLKMMSTQLHMSMQEATEQAVAQWLTSKEVEQEKMLQAFNAIKEKLQPEEKKVIEAILEQKNRTAVNVVKKDLSIEENSVLEALLAQKKAGN